MMMYSAFFRPQAAVMVVLFMIMVGCTTISAPSRFYVLSSLPDSGTEREIATEEGCITIGIGPVEIAPYLDRPQIVTRVSANELHLADFDKWAEPLKDSFSRVLSENLSALLCADAIAVFPWRGSTPIDYRVEVAVVRLDGKLGGDAFLVAQWTIFGEDGRTVLLTRKSSYTEPADPRDYEALVAAQSRTVANLTRDIAAAIKDISKAKRTP